MSIFYQYSLESSICLAVLLLPYLLWFRNATFYQWNRLYLLGAIFFSLSAPLVNIEIETPAMVKMAENLQLFEENSIEQPILETENLTSKTEAITPYKQQTIEVSETKQNSSLWQKIDWGLGIYLFGVSIFTFLFLFRFFKLLWLIYTGKQTKEKGFTSIHLQGKQAFSFFNFVFFDQQLYNGKEKIALIEHEQVHIKQGHSVDVLILEILQIVFWFNPLFRLYKKLIQQEHEYFVDAAISSKLGKTQYAKLLLNLATDSKPVLGHAFAYIPIKHRIFKLLQKPSTAMEKSKFLIAIPVFITLFFTFSCSMEEVNDQSNIKISSYKKVNKINIYFLHNFNPIEGEKLMMEVKFDEKGVIYDVMNNFSWYMANSDIESYKVYSNHSMDFDKEFYARNIHFMIMKDDRIKMSHLLLYHKHIPDLASLDINMLRNSSKHQLVQMEKLNNNYNTSYQIDNVLSQGDKINFYNATRKEAFGESEIAVHIKSNEQGFPTKWIKKMEYNPDNKGIDHNELLTYSKFKEEHSFEMEYDDQQRLSRLSYTTFFKQAFLQKEEWHTNHEDFVEAKFFYDNNYQKINEIELHNIRGTLLRKYRFHYNEAGYCTKKECINREGNVEFSVRFEYDFFE